MTINNQLNSESERKSKTWPTFYGFRLPTFALVLERPACRGRNRYVSALGFIELKDEYFEFPELDGEDAPQGGILHCILPETYGTLLEHPDDFSGLTRERVASIKQHREKGTDIHYHLVLFGAEMLTRVPLKSVKVMERCRVSA